MEKERQVILIADLGFGDVGKGSLTDYLTRQLNAHTIIRYNGGAQAGHNVIAPDGRNHIFSQFGSGTFVEGTKTHLSRFMLVDPLSMLKEERHLRTLGITDALARTTIDGEAPVITPFHQASNRLLTLNSKNRFSSTGRGVSEAMADYLRFGRESLVMADLLDGEKTKRKLQFLRDIQQDKVKDLRDGLPKTETVEVELKVLDDPDVVDYSLDLYKHFTSLIEIVDRDYLGKLFSLPGSVIFEGAQGVLLDQKYGFYPYITRSNAAFENANILLLENDYQGQVVKLGVLRAYATRHGAGPFPTEDATLSNLLLDVSNTTNLWQGNFRVGFFDLVTAEYAMEVLGSLDGLVLTHLDRLRDMPYWRVCNSYTYKGEATDMDLFFDTTDKLVQRIKVCKIATNPYQQRLGELLNYCVPNYILPPSQKDPDDFIHFIEDLTQMPITVTSSGPTAADKRIIKL